MTNKMTKTTKTGSVLTMSARISRGLAFPSVQWTVRDAAGKMLVDGSLRPASECGAMGEAMLAAGATHAIRDTKQTVGLSAAEAGQALAIEAEMMAPLAGEIQMARELSERDRLAASCWRDAKAGDKEWGQGNAEACFAVRKREDTRVEAAFATLAAWDLAHPAAAAEVARLAEEKKARSLAAVWS